MRKPRRRRGAKPFAGGGLAAAAAGRRRLLRALAAVFLSPFALAAAPAAAGRAAESRRHHLPGGGFRNNHIDAIDKPFSDLMRWRREAPEVKLIRFPLAKNDPAFLAANRRAPTLTWIGHATVLLQAGGFNILTDPHFTRRASPFSFAGPKRTTPPGLAMEHLPPLDAILISHNHYDHLDAASVGELARLQPAAAFFVPLRLRKTVARMIGGAGRVVELDWGEEATIGGLRLVAEPCQHWSKRGLGDANKTLWASWVAEAGDFRFLFIGDTGYSRDFADLGEKYGGFDAAAIPIGAYEPRWFMRQAHVDPGEAAKILRDVGARFALATHWGTFSLTDEPMDEPPQKLRQALAQAGVDDSRFAVFRHGETRDLSFLTAAAAAPAPVAA